MAEPTILIGDNRLRTSIVQNIATLITAIGPATMGWFMGSAALQWLGFCLFWLWVIAKTASYGKQMKKSPQEAADWLAEKFGVIGRKP